jgi:hypothetical protein
VFLALLRFTQTLERQAVAASFGSPKRTMPTVLARQRPAIEDFAVRSEAFGAQRFPPPILPLAY